MIDPDSDPGEPWRDGLLAAGIVVVLGAYLLLNLAGAIRDLWAMTDPGVISGLQRLLG